jgi:hypothetical protein
MLGLKNQSVRGAAAGRFLEECRRPHLICALHAQVVPAWVGVGNVRSGNTVLRIPDVTLICMSDVEYLD